MTKHFCCCFSLKIGAIMMCFLTMLEGLLEVIIASFGFTDLEKVKKLKETTSAVTSKVLNRTVCEVAGAVCNKTRHAAMPVENTGYEGYLTLFIVCMILGFLSLYNGSLLLYGIIQAKEKCVLWYLFLSSINLFIVIIYAGINMFSNTILIVLFLISVFMCYGQLSVYYFYEEVAEYNMVKSGAIEIAFNGDPKSYANSVVPIGGSVGNTAV